jgi:hypothetical protein
VTSPDTDEAAWTELAQILDRFFGEQGFSEITERFTSIGATEVVRTPATFLRALQEQANRTLDARPLPSDGAIEVALLESIALLDRMGLAAERKPGSLGSPAGRAALQLLRRVAAGVGVEALMDVVARVGVPRMRTWRTMNAILPLARLADSDDLGDFEDAIRTAARTFKDAHELWYGPLVLTYRAVAALEHGADPFAPLTVGKAEVDLKSWGANDLVDPTARLIRNAEAHAALEIDLATETVSFLAVNGKSVAAGPWDRARFMTATSAFFSRCAILSWALVAFVVNATQAALLRQKVE